MFLACLMIGTICEPIKEYWVRNHPAYNAKIQPISGSDKEYSNPQEYLQQLKDSLREYREAEQRRRQDEMK